LKIIEVIANNRSFKTVSTIAKNADSYDFRAGAQNEDGMQTMRILLRDDAVQKALDSLQTILGAQQSARILVIPVEATLPKLPDESKKKDSAVVAREALYESVVKNAHLDFDFVLLVMLSTMVAAIGLVENNVAVVIGAMVIAPLLGPNLALGLATALGDTDLMRESLMTTAVGLLMAILLSVLIGYLWPFSISSPELMSRTDAGIESIALALASGAAAALSLTTGLSSVLVGVMVSVALLPPAATVGLMLGHGNHEMALGATLLLAVNIVCVNLASKIVFWVKGIRPRTWLEKEKAQKGMRISMVVWITSLMMLLFVILVRSDLLTL